jgi:hypothetical protein
MWTFTVPMAGTTVNSELDFDDCHTEIQEYHSTGFDFSAGGAVSIDMFMETLTQILNQMADLLPPELPVDTLLQALNRSLPKYATYDLDGDGRNDSFSIGIVGTTVGAPYF